VGAIAGAGLVAALTPAKYKFGMGDGGPGCFDRLAASQDITKSQIFGWEVSRTARVGQGVNLRQVLLLGCVFGSAS
jgi:hypothetical protein